MFPTDFRTSNSKPKKTRKKIKIKNTEHYLSFTNNTRNSRKSTESVEGVG